MEIVHDIAEAIVGDITLSDGIPKLENSKREKEALEQMCKLLGGGPRAEEIHELWMQSLIEIEENDSILVGFVHPSQFAAMNDTSQANPSDMDMAFWSKDHKLGISTDLIHPLYIAAKHAFMSSLQQYKMLIGALQSKIINYGATLTTFGMLLRFVVETMVVSSLIMALRGDVLYIPIIQVGVTKFNTQVMILMKSMKNDRILLQTSFTGDIFYNIDLILGGSSGINWDSSISEEKVEERHLMPSTSVSKDAKHHHWTTTGTIIMSSFHQPSTTPEIGKKR
uniref:HD domain-containing protein n=1 Tax=Lactuca sativa TaxID=4236 RepID=A0A9R1X0S0_LACSA|nr:hypothetical protein LSAT_V11C700346380 [Lactuca sativa]